MRGILGRRMSGPLAGALLLAGPVVPLAGSEDWPGWRGPTGSGVAAQALFAEVGSVDHLRWKVEIPGRGLSSPIVVGDRVFLSTAVPTGPPSGIRVHPEIISPTPQELVVLGLRCEDGSVVFRRTLHQGTPHQAMHQDASFATPTLVSDGEHLVVSFGSLGLYVLTLDGELLWSVDLGDLNIRDDFGEGSSPALAEGILVQLFDHEGESFVVALDVETGAERWRTPRPRGTNWTTPQIARVNGEYQVIAGAERTVAYDLHMGDEIWWLGDWPGLDASQPRPRGSICVMASPVAVGDLLIVHRGAELGLTAIHLPDADGDLADSEAVRWTYRRDLPEVSSPLLHEGLVYFVKGNQGILVALNAATGERVHGPVRLQGVTNVYASPIAAGPHVFVAGRDGEIEVVRAGPRLETVALHVHEDRFDASPAVAGGRLFLRGRQHLYCFGETKR